LAFHSGREADHSLPSNAEVKECVELYLHSPNTPSWRGAQGEHRDNFVILLKDDCNDCRLFNVGASNADVIYRLYI
jgi:hypothetical protein